MDWPHASPPDPFDLDLEPGFGGVEVLFYDEAHDLAIVGEGDALDPVEGGLGDIIAIDRAAVSDVGAEGDVVFDVVLSVVPAVLIDG